MSEALYWLGFSLVPEIGPRRISLLRTGFATLQEAWAAPEAALQQAGLDGKALNNLLRAREKLDLPYELERIHRAGAALIAYDDDQYPAILKSLPDAPPVLYVRGALMPADANAVAVVGTRKATNYGRSAAQQLSKQLAARGVTIVSGLAQGIDAAAHRGALETGRTIAVLGCGIDRVYPAEHHELADVITQRGAVISEFPLGVPPEGRNFPRRNRLISGLARGVIVVEAPEQSGAIITATTAAEQGREVFAVPGSIFSSSSAGAHRLIQDGATLVMRARDVLDALSITELPPPSIVMPSREDAPAIPSAEASFPESDAEIMLMRHLSAKPLHIDDLVAATGFPTATVSSALMMLELKGLAQNIGNMQYCLNS
jgi:DNA processing protein